MNPNVNIRTVTLNAGGAGAQQRVNAAGTCLTFISNGGAFQFSLDDGPPQDGASILVINLNGLAGALLPSGKTVVEGFSSVTLIDKSGGANTIEFIVSNAPVQFSQLVATGFVKEAPTYTKATGSQVIADGGLEEFTGVDVATGKSRRTFIVTNMGAITLYVLDSSGNQCFPVLADKIPRVMNTSGDAWVSNPPGSGAGAYMVTEIFYA